MRLVTPSLLGLGLGLVLVTAGSALGADEDRPVAVTVAPLSALAVEVERSAPAEVFALARTRVAARLNTTVEAVTVEAGDRVEAGAPLARLECTDFRDSLEQAEASLAEFKARLRLADIRLTRTRELRQQNAVSADRLDEADAERATLEAGVRAQRTRVAAARRDVDRCTVAAPFAGLVVARPGEPGAFAQAGTPLVELVATDRVELRAQLTTGDAATLDNGTRAQFRADGRRYPVEPITIVASADTRARTRLARLRFAGDPPIPGTAGRLHWVAHAAAVPADLIVRRNGRLGVFTVEHDRARFHALAEAIEGRPAATDLAPTARLIVEGRHGATDGRRVRVVE